MQIVGIDHIEVEVAEDADSCVAANSKMRIAAAGEYPRLHIAVVEARHHFDIECHLAFDAFDDSNQLAARTMASAGAHGKEVGDPRDVAARPVGGHQDEGVVIYSRLTCLALGSDDEMAALLPVQQTTETTIGIEPGETAPVDGAGAGDQRGCVAITDQGIVGDGGIRMRGTSYSTKRRAGCLFKTAARFPSPCRSARRHPSS